MGPLWFRQVHGD